MACDWRRRIDAGQAGVEISVAPWAHEQLTHDQQRPPLADDVERPRETAELSIRAHDGRYVTVRERFK